MQKLRCTGVNCGIPISNMSYVLPISPKGIEDNVYESWGSFRSLVTVTRLEDRLKIITVTDVSSRYFSFLGYDRFIIFFYY